MRITRLDITGLRRFDTVSLAPGPALNLLTGANGAGKTSVLEAMHLMAYGRSFRGRVRDGLIRQDVPALEIFVEWEEAGGRVRKAGLRHTGAVWQGRLDGADVAHLGELCAALAVVTFEPGSHDLVTGGAENRRRLLDWGLFHVEPDFLRVWRRYARALKQRNALLKAGGRTAELDGWEHELAESGEAITRSRETYLAQWQPRLAERSRHAGAGAGHRATQPPARLAARGGQPLRRPAAGAPARPRHGIHQRRARIAPIGASDSPASRVATPCRAGRRSSPPCALLLSQARLHAGLAGEWPVIALDDLASELDRAHQARVVDDLVATGAQVFVTGTEAPEALLAHADRLAHVHVEEGRLRAEGQAR